jgi:hypothetical protein
VGIGDAARYQFLDIWVDPFTIDSFLHYVRCVTTARRPTVIAHHNLNSLAICRRSPVIRSFYDQVDAVFVDGMGVVATARLVGAPIRVEHRLASSTGSGRCSRWLLGSGGTSCTSEGVKTCSTRRRGRSSPGTRPCG